MQHSSKEWCVSLWASIIFLGQVLYIFISRELYFPITSTDRDDDDARRASKIEDNCFMIDKIISI